MFNLFKDLNKAFDGSKCLDKVSTKGSNNFTESLDVDNTIMDSIDSTKHVPDRTVSTRATVTPLATFIRSSSLYSSTSKMPLAVARSVKDINSAVSTIQVCECSPSGMSCAIRSYTTNVVDGAFYKVSNIFGIVFESILDRSTNVTVHSLCLNNNQV